MTRFVACRILLAVPTLFGVCLVVFVIVKIVPGDPVASLLGPLSTPQTRHELTERLGLGRPLPIQFGLWLWHTVQGDLGVSIAQQRSVSDLVLAAFGNTLVLAAGGALIAMVLGLTLGGLAAVRGDRPSGRIAHALAVVATSAPQYSVAMLLVAFVGVSRHLFPTSGMHDPGGGGLVDLLHHLVLPAVSVALIPAGVTARMFETALKDARGGELTENMRARGLRERTILLHSVRTTLPSLLTITGLQLAYLIGGVVFVETIFSWPGIGLALYQAISARDLPLIQGGVLLIAVAFVAINITVDSLHAAVDPRVRR